MQNTEKILDALLELYKNYSHIHRRAIVLDKYSLVCENNPNIEPENKLVRESLLEHVGCLPVVATYLYPFLDHKSKIDLGKVLTMLAIHDIGEIVVGDGHPHQKTPDFINSEHREALKLLSTNYHSLFEEYEEGESLEAKLTKSVDVFATFLPDLLLPRDFIAKRLAAYGFSSQLFVEKRTVVFDWDNTLHELFKEVIKRLQARGL